MYFHISIIKLDMERIKNKKNALTLGWVFWGGVVCLFFFFSFWLFSETCLHDN